MNVYGVSGAPIVALGLGMVAVKGLAPFATPSVSAGTGAFVEACVASMKDTASWAMREAEHAGKNVSFAQSATFAYKLPSVCGCMEEALAGEVTPDRLVVAGHMAGLHFKSSLALRAKDKGVKERARETAAEDIRALASEHDLSTREIGVLFRPIDAAVRTCLARSFSRR